MSQWVDVAEARPDRPGWRLVELAWGSTALLIVALVLGVVAPDSLAIVVVVVSLVLFLAGIVAFIWSYAIAVNRSRTDELSVAGLYMLAEGAPRWARLHLLGAMAVQVVVSVTAAAVRPFTAVAFGILAPMMAVGLAGLWSARHGEFRPRMADQTVMGNTRRRWQNQEDSKREDAQMLDEATENRIINASPARCREVATDISSYPEWTADLKAVEVIESDDQGRPTLVTFRAAAMGRSTNYTLRYDHSEAPERLSWVQAEGDITKRLDGWYRFDPVDGEPEQCSVTYHLEVELVVPLPGFVKRRAEGRIIHTALADLQQRAEQ